VNKYVVTPPSHDFFRFFERPTVADNSFSTQNCHKGRKLCCKSLQYFSTFFLFCSSSKSFSFFSMGKFSSQQHFKSWLETKKSDIFLGFKSFLEDFGRRGSTKWQKNWGTLWKILIFVQKSILTKTLL